MYLLLNAPLARTVRYYAVGGSHGHTRSAGAAQRLSAETASCPQGKHPHLGVGAIAAKQPWSGTLVQT